MAASGAPDRTEDHAKNVADLAIQLISQVRLLTLPSTLDIKIRIGKADSTVDAKFYSG